MDDILSKRSARAVLSRAMQDRITVFEHERMVVWCYPARGIIHHQVKQYVSGMVFREALNRGIEAMSDCGGSKWLSDDRLNGALLPSDLKWADEVWFPKTLQAGWKYWAHLPPASIIGQMNIRRHVQLYKERGVAVQPFEDLDAAVAWLVSQPTPGRASRMDG
jgi:hypothetical protein